jgi:predicted phage tail protein
MKRVAGSGGGGGGCFLGHTLVRTPNGEQRIDELKPGDQVLSFDDRGIITPATVLKVHEHAGERVIRYTLWGGAVLDATPNHWVLNQFNAFVEIDTLGGDDCLVDENNHLRPIVGKAEFCTGIVYNLTVEGHHTFIAGGIRVHNAGLGLGISGSGGGGGGGGKGSGGASSHTPTEAGNSLFSTSYAKLVDLISEGEIVGLKDGLKSIYVENTPLQNADNTYNFQNVSVFTRTGTQAQDYIPGFDDIANEVSVGVNVLQTSPVIRSITNSAINAARLTITVPQLQKFEDNGDINGASVQLQIAVQYNSGGYTTVVDDVISGRTSQNYQRQYLINLSGAFPVNIKVTRVTADSGSAKLADAFSWTSYTEVTYAKLAYPNSALIGVRINAEQFSNIPSRAYRIRGIKVKIPSNATPDSTTGRLIYSGTWNGTFGAAQWTSDPAWCLWDLLTARYGFKDHIDTSQLDKWAFYSASQYCSALVPDGFGGTEPRFSCNVNIQTAEDAYKLIGDMSSVFRAMPYWSTGALTVSQDKPADPAYLFTLANVSEEGFGYSGSSLKTRPTVAVVQYMDLDLRNTAYEVVEDQAGIAKFGVIKTEITAFACTSRGQAHRLGEWLLYSSQSETETVAFTASIDAGTLVRPGQIIEISDPVRAGSRRGGRINSATTTTVTVDDATGLSTTNSPVLSVILSDGTVQARAVSTVVGNVITVASAFSSAPNANSVWIYENSTLQSTTWRVLGVQEQDQCKYTISALAYSAGKYDYIERGVALQPRTVSNLNSVPAPPTNLSLTEALYSYQTQVRSKIIVNWRGIAGVTQYIVKWRKDSGNWTTITRQQQDYEILDTTPGLFEINVYSLSAGGQSSASALTGTISALGKTAPPSGVTGFSYAIDTDLGLLLTWNPLADIDVAGYEIRRGSTWESATSITTVTATTYKVGYLDDGNYTYLIKAYDTSGVYSTSAVSTTVTFTSAPAPTVAITQNGSNVIINWTPVAGSLATKFYEVRYGATYATASVLTTVQSTTFTVRGNWTGSRTFWVVAVDPRARYGTPGSASFTITAPPQPSITSTITGSTLMLTWAAVKGTLETAYYEVRRGSTFSSATSLGKVNSTNYGLTVNWGGAQTFWVVAYDVNDTIGTEANSTVTVTAPTQPTITQQVIDNNVLLRWGDCTQTLPIDSYELRKGSTWATAAVIGTKKGLFTSTFETESATYTYWLAGIDTAGSYGTPGSVTAQVNQPPDYVLKLNQNSTFSGTKTNIVSDVGGQLATVNTSETWQSHFTTRSWTTPQDQINAGYPIYALPSQTTGSYEESFDYGTVLAGTKVTAVLTSTNVAGSTTVAPTLSVRKLVTDAWTNYPGLSEVYATQFRYFKVKYDFASAGGDDLLLLTGLNVRLDSKIKNDSGNGTANSADSGGTVVTFNTAFVDVDAISVTPLTTSAVIAVYDFTDVPNPTSFKVLLFNTSGTRVSGGFSWSARGV